MIVRRRCTSCCSSVENIPLQAERHAARRQKLFAFQRNRRSPSDRNAVRNHNGIFFGFRAESRSPSTGFPSNAVQNRTTRLGQPIHGRFVFPEAVKDDIHSKVGLFARSWCRTSVRNWAWFRRCRAPQGRMGARHERAETPRLRVNRGVQVLHAPTAIAILCGIQGVNEIAVDVQFDCLGQGVVSTTDDSRIASDTSAL